MWTMQTQELKQTMLQIVCRFCTSSSNGTIHHSKVCVSNIVAELSRILTAATTKLLTKCQTLFGGWQPDDPNRKPLLLRPHCVRIVCSPNFHDLLAGEFAYCTANVLCSRPNMFELWSYQRTWQATGFLGPRYLRSGYLGLARSSTSCNLPKFQIFFCESKGSIEEHR